MKKVLVTVCAALLLTVFCFNAAEISRAENALPEKDTALALSSKTDRLAAAASAVYKRASDLVLSLPYASINLSQTALMKVYSGEQADALRYLNAHANTELANAYAAMDEIIADYDRVLKTYSVSQSDPLRHKRAELADIFSGLRSSASELIRRTRTLISAADGGTSYTAYCTQLIVLSDKFQAAATSIGSEYDALMQSLIGSDYSAIF